MKLKEGPDNEIHLTDALKKLDALYESIYEGKTYYIENRLDWLKAPIEIGLDDNSSGMNYSVLEN